MLQKRPLSGNRSVGRRRRPVELRQQLAEQTPEEIGAGIARDAPDLAAILERLTDPADRAAVVRCAKGIYWLYGEVFRSLEATPNLASVDEPQRRIA